MKAEKDLEASPHCVSKVVLECFVHLNIFLKCIR